MTLRIIWFFILMDVIVDGQLTNCPKDSIKFEKVIGLRPSDSNHPLLLYKNKNNQAIPPVTAECIDQCNSNSDCRSFVVYYNVSTCYWFKNAIQGVQELENVVDTNAAWFVKVCLQVKNCVKAWTFDSIPGATLVGSDTKILPKTQTRTECQQYCLNETKFSCRSAKFRIKSSDYGPNDETRGICILSDTDRHILPSAYRVSVFDDEYFENQCTKVANESRNAFCSYEEYEGAMLAHSDFFYESQTKDGCQKLCEDSDVFNCRGYSLVSVRNGYNCLLHSEDSKVHGPRLLKDNPSGYYYEKTQCLNISLTCTETYMTVTYTPNMKFMGRMYMEGYSEQPECYVQGLGTNSVVLKLSVLSSQCGLIKATEPANRTLMAGIMILQYNALVQTQGDRTIRIGCSYGSGNDSTLVLGTGITITSAPNRGSALTNSSSTAVTSSPLVEMRILDLETQGEVSSTQIGQELQLVIEMKPVNGTLDMWVSHLVAMTEDSDESILLLDDNGCATNLNIFPPLTKTVTNDTRKLTATFQAFKFSSSPIVRFSVVVQFCPDTCPSVDCGNATQPNDRNRRELETRTLETIDGTKIVKVNRTEFETLNSAHQMPLEFIMIVRNPVANSDRLVLGDGKILVAGYDYTTNEVCLDYSLFVGLIITWVLIQIIFITCCIVMVRRYKKYYEEESTTQSLEELHKNFGMGFGNLDNRRVHWADNRDYT